MDFMAADIVFTREKAWFSRMIRWGTKHTGEEPTWASHCGIGLNPACFAEALVHVVVTEWSVLMHRDPETFQVWRYDPLTPEHRKAIADRVSDFLGCDYGWFKIGLQAGDGFLGKIFGREIYLFRRLSMSDKLPICSYVVPHGYEAIGYDFGINANAATPDDIHDHVSKTDGWRRVT